MEKIIKYKNKTYYLVYIGERPEDEFKCHYNYNICEMFECSSCHTNTKEQKEWDDNFHKKNKKIIISDKSELAIKAMFFQKYNTSEMIDNMYISLDENIMKFNGNILNIEI